MVDGDTIYVTVDGKKESVRFIGIDSPELSSTDPLILCLANAAKTALTNRIGKNEVSLEADSTQHDRDKYDRLLRYVILPDGTNLNAWLVEEGFAYEYTYQVPYAEQAAFKASQKDAEANKRGLWGDLCATTVKSSSPPAVTPSSPPPTTQTGYTCAGKTTCGQMSGCAEAKFYLTQCGLSRLDGDHDGTPCESLCK